MAILIIIIEQGHHKQNNFHSKIIKCLTKIMDHYSQGMSGRLRSRFEKCLLI